ncbi:invasion associated locus B family protein [Altericroceibacterium indicum]|nr:invasion associated locus B family protein [Altericroceibacterium indicum]
MRRCVAISLVLACALPGSALAARDSLGVYDHWGSFKDPSIPRCYAIAISEKPRGKPDAPLGSASVGTWPKKQVHGQLYLRLSRELATGSAITLSIGKRRFSLMGSGNNAWARDKAMDAAIISAMRSAEGMSVRAIGSDKKSFTDRYRLEGAASAMDAATLACAKIR